MKKNMSVKSSNSEMWPVTHKNG